METMILVHQLADDTITSINSAYTDRYGSHLGFDTGCLQCKTGPWRMHKPNCPSAWPASETTRKYTLAQKTRLTYEQFEATAAALGPPEAEAGNETELTAPKGQEEDDESHT